MERERFKGNLNVMGGAGKGSAAGADTGDGANAISEGGAGGAAGGTWAALRAHIASGMAKDAPVGTTAAPMEDEVL